MTEADFERAIVDLAHLFDWHAVGHRPMRTKHGWATGWKYDGTGWPDLTLVHPTGIILLAELKVTTALSADQETWRDRLTTAETAALESLGMPHDLGPIRYRLWKPDNWPTIKTELSFGKAR